MALAIVASALIAGAAVDWQWCAALGRSLFGNQPYTEVSIEQGDVQIDEGSSQSVSATVLGRVGRPTKLWTRVVGDPAAQWSDRALTDADTVRRDPNRVEYLVELPDIKQSLEYRVSAGLYFSESRRVAVRHPLNIESIHVAVEPPAYTGAAATEFTESRIRALAGSKARFSILLDRPAESATLVLTPADDATADGNEPTEAAIPLTVEGRTLSGEIELTQDAWYSVAGRAADGAPVRGNRGRVRIQLDRPPRIAFSEPPLELEVHSLAEVVVRAQAEDDFGLTSMGIVFQINNGEEYPLIVRDFSPPDAAKAEGGASASASRSSSHNGARAKRAAVNKLLPLEALGLTQKDTIAYYAFAEDNSPGGARVRTELRYIDIRPFRRRYVQNQGGGGSGGGPQLPGLEQLIRRERFLVNRSMGFASAGTPRGAANVDDVDDAMRLQQDTASFTRQLAESALEAEDILNIEQDRISDLLFAADEAMMRAVDSLAVANFPTSTLQQVDAASSLVAARDAIELALEGEGGGVFRRLLGLDNRLAALMQGKGRSIRLSSLIHQLRDLAERENRLAEELAGLTRDRQPADEDPEAANRLRTAEKKQADATVDAEKVDDLIQKFAKATDLVRARSGNSVAAAASVSSALERGEIDEAADDAYAAAAMFRELAQHLDGISAPEPAGRIATARDVASHVAGALRGLRSDVLAAAGDGETSSQRLNELARQALMQAESAATVDDVLDATVNEFATTQDDVAERITSLAAETETDQADDLLSRIEEPHRTS